jgi:RNA polymerase sigma-70 factor (ECF subfamily)
LLRPHLADRIAWTADAVARSDEDENGPAALPPGESPEARFEALYREQAPRLQRRLRSRLRSAEDARDMVQDAFARLLGARALPREPAAFLNRIVRNLMIDRARRAKAHGPEVTLTQADEPWTEATQTEAIELAQMRALYLASVNALPKRTREVFLLHRVDGLPYKEIAALLEISTRTVEWHVAEAIVRIGRDLRR